MKFFRRHWYEIGGIIAIGAIAYLVFAWNQMDIIDRLLLMSFIAILAHQYEEYGFPGGEPAIMNMALQNSDLPDRYPLNQNSALITNVLVAYTVYLLPVFLPHVIWLGLAPMLMGFAQFAVHGIMTNRKLKSIYNPGLGAVVFLHFPIGIYYIYYVVSNGLVHGTDWILSLIYLAFIAGVIVNGLTYKVLANRNSKYPFDQAEMERFHVKEKLEKMPARSTALRKE
jgi:hypothetical protein